MNKKKCKKSCKKLLFQYQYFYNDAEITKFPSINSESAFFDFYCLTTDKKITLANFYCDTSNQKKFQENWLITDELGNQIIFGGFSDILRGPISTGTADYAISSTIGELWTEVNEITIEFLPNGIRNIFFYKNNC